MGSRLPLAYARKTGANLLTAGALDAARARASAPEPHQRFDHQRLWTDLLWSPTMAFHLFGDLAADLRLADRAVHAWWPQAPGTLRDVRFRYSDLLTDRSTFAPMTIEELLDAGALPPKTATGLRERYIVS